MTLDDGQHPMPDRGVEPKRTGKDELRACVPGRPHQGVQLLMGVGDTRKYGSDEEASSDTRGAQPAESTQAHLGDGRAGLEAVGELWIGAHQ